MAGTSPIGAVVVDGDGTIVAAGRNAVHESSGAGPLSASPLAHGNERALRLAGRRSPRRPDLAAATDALIAAGSASSG